MTIDPTASQHSPAILAEVLRSALPGASSTQVERLTNLLVATLDRRLPAQDVAAQLNADPGLRALAECLKGQDITAEQSLIQFSDGRVGGNVEISNAAGGNITHLTIYTQAPSTPSATQTLAEAQERLAQLPLDAVPLPAPLPTKSRMWLAPNRLFGGRTEELRALAAAIKQDAPSTPVAITGLGGIGKTQLAVEFVHRYGQYFSGGVFWISFERPADIANQIAACGSAAGLERADMEGLSIEEQAERVRHAWQSLVPRLLIFDNCEEQQALDIWRPISGGCHILVTTRRAQWDGVLDVQTQPLAVLARHESIALLRRLHPALPPHMTPYLDAIADELGDLPLALQLAGHFLRTFANDTDPQAYLHELRVQPVITHESLRDSDGAISPTRHLLDVGRTFALSYDRLNRQNRVDHVALALLARAARLVPDTPIMHALLVDSLLDCESRAQPQVTPPTDGGMAASVGTTGGVAQRRQITRGLIRLADLGLLEQAADGAAFRIHRLLAAFVNKYTHDSYAQAAVERALIHTIHQVEQLDDQSGVATLLPHLRHVREHTPTDRRPPLHQALGTLYGWLGFYAEAADMLEQAIQGLRSRAQSHDEQVTVVASPKPGRYGTPPDCHQHTNNHLLGVARCLHIRATMYLRSGQFGPALRDVVEAQSLFASLRCVQEVADCQRDRGLVAAYLGQFDQAIAWTLRARAAYAQQPQSSKTVWCDLHLANIMFYQGRHTWAQAIYRHIAEHCTAPGWWQYQLVALLNQVALLSAQHHFDAALALLDTVTPPTDGKGEQIWRAYIGQLQAKVLHDMGRYGIAATQLAQFSQRPASTGNLPAAAIGWLSAGWAYLNQAIPDLDAAEQCFEKVGQQLDDQPMGHWQLEHGRGRCAVARGHLPEALAHLWRASQSVATLHGRMASQHAAHALLNQTKQLYHEALQLAADLNQPTRVLELIEQQRALALRFPLVQPPQSGHDARPDHTRQLPPPRIARTATDDCLTPYSNLLLHTPSPARETTAAPYAANLDLTQLRQFLDKAYSQDWLALVVQPCGTELLVLTCDSQQITLERTPYDESLQEWLRQVCHPAYRQQILLMQPLAMAMGSLVDSPLDRLGARLIPATLHTQLHATRRLIIITSGVLQALPWAALRIHGTWLCELAIIQLLPSLMVWPELAARPLPGDAALLVGCGTFGGRARPFPSAHRALDTPEAYWPGPTTRIEDQQASRTAILALSTAGALHHYGLLHISSHAQLFHTAGLPARLLLYDDDLLFDDIARLRLRGALVILAASDGTTNLAQSDTDIISLAWALLTAGASDVVATLWPTPDGSGPVALTAFYEHLRAGHDASTALALAQRALIRQCQAKPAPTCTPLAWASLCVTGAGVPHRIPPKQRAPAHEAI